jgi:hypothetical protein
MEILFDEGLVWPTVEIKVVNPISVAPILEPPVWRIPRFLYWFDDWYQIQGILKDAPQYAPYCVPKRHRWSPELV